MKSSMLPRIISSLAAIAIVALTGCATASKPQAMTVAASTFSKQNPQSVSVNVTGGSETTAAGASKISNKDFAAAIEESIKNTRLFKDVSATGADYHLEVYIARLEQPMFGFSMTVTLETNWTLSHTSDKAVIWQKAIPTTFTARAGDALAGVTRLRLANEGAARTNIESALREIAALDLR